MLEGFARGLAAFLGLTLVAAGTLKLVQLELTRRSLIRLLPPRRRPRRTLLTLTAVALGTGEVGFGAILVVAPTPLTASAAVLLCAGFVAVVTIARRRGAACGCFGSFSVRASGPVESARALALLGTSVALFSVAVVVATGDRPGRPNLFGTATGFVLGLTTAAVAVGLATMAAGPYRSPRDLLVAARAALRRRDGWRPARPWHRRRITRAVRAHSSVQDVEGRAPVAFTWRYAKVQVSGRPVRITSVVVPAAGARLHVLVPASGPLAVVCYAPTGVITPRRTAPVAAAAT